MCIIAAVPAGLKLDKATFDRCWDKNPDGFGMTYLYSGELRIKKTMRKDTAWSIYNGVTNAVSDSWMILHFRIGTHGTKDLTNCHPFKIHNGLVFAHNGIIKAVPDCPDRLLSDTQMFNNLILKHLPEDFYQYKHYQMLIEDYIGYSKLVFLDINNDLYIYNEAKGEWHDGVWFSNSGYKEIPKYVPVKVVNKELDKEEQDWLKRADDRYSEMYPYRPVDRLETQQCEYCCCWKSRGKKYDNVGFLCDDCIQELKNANIDPNIDLDDKTLDELISLLFAKDIEEDDIQVVEREAETSIYCGGKWMTYDEYMRNMGYYESYHYNRRD